MTSTISAFNAELVGYNVQEIGNNLATISAAAIVDIEALQAGGLVADLATAKALVGGTAAVGNGTKAARDNHVHPPIDAKHYYGGDAAVGTTLTYLPFARLPAASTVTALKIVPMGAVTANGTNYATITVTWVDGAGSGAAVLATLLTNVAGGDWVAQTTKDMGAITSAVVPAGGVLLLSIAKAAGGVQLPGFLVTPVFG